VGGVPIAVLIASSLSRDQYRSPGYSAAHVAPTTPTIYGTKKMILMRRITTAHLTTLADQLSTRDQAILTDLERTRVFTGTHLQRLHFAHIDAAARARDRRCRSDTTHRSKIGVHTGPAYRQDTRRLHQAHLRPSPPPHV
jgi:hypothetical protein